MTKLYAIATLLGSTALFAPDAEGAGGVADAPDAPADTSAPNPAEPAAEQSTALASITGNLPTLKQFDPNAPAEFGNSYLESLLKLTMVDEELQQATETVESTKKFVHFELTRAVMSAAERGKDINLYKVFEGAKEVERLNSRILQHFGVISKKVVDDDVVTDWSSPEMAKAYDYASLDKEKDEKEHTRRFNNRKRLNMRLSEAFKAACALMDGKVKSDDLKLIENSTTKEVEAVIENAPDFLRGDKAKNGSTITFGKRSANEGASVAPNIASLVKAATAAHKKADDEESQTDKLGERPDKGSERSGDAKLGMSDEDFGAIVNNLRRAISAQEGSLTPEMVKQLQHLVPFIDEQIKVTLEKPTLEDLPDEDPTEGAGEGVDTTAVEAEEAQKAAAAEIGAAADKPAGKAKK